MNKNAIAVVPAGAFRTFSRELMVLQQEQGLTAIEVGNIQYLIEEHRTSVNAIARLLTENRLTVAQVGEVYEVRARLNEVLSSELEQTLSLKAIITFQQAFPSVPLDADVLVERLGEIHSRCPDEYLGNVLGRLVELHKEFPDALPESLLDFFYVEGEVSDEDQ